MSIFVLILTIGFGSVILLNLIFAFSFQTIKDLFYCFAVVMLPAGIFLFAGRLMPRKLFNENMKIYKVGKIKNKICDITRVKSWKEKLPVGGRVAGFRLNKIEANIEYLDRYVYESCFADWLHFVIVVWSLLSMLILPRHLFFNMAFPIAMLFAFQNITSVIIQWYTRPRVIRIRDNLINREKAKEN